MRTIAQTSETFGRTSEAEIEDERLQLVCGKVRVVDENRVVAACFERAWEGHRQPSSPLLGEKTRDALLPVPSKALCDMQYQSKWNGETMPLSMTVWQWSDSQLFAIADHRVSLHRSWHCRS